MKKGRQQSNIRVRDGKKKKSKQTIEMPPGRLAPLSRSSSKKKEGDRNSHRGANST